MIVCDDGRYIEESMKIIKENDRITKISKQITEDEAYGVSIDVYKFSNIAGTQLFGIVNNIINNEKNLNSWTEVLRKIEFHSLDIKYKWVEIDNHDDLKYAEEIF